MNVRLFARRHCPLTWWAQATNPIRIGMAFSLGGAAWFTAAAVISPPGWTTAAYGAAVVAMVSNAIWVRLVHKLEMQAAEERLSARLWKAESQLRGQLVTALMQKNAGASAFIRKLN